MNAADSVWALVSGLPRGLRERRLIMVLQAFIDESKTDGEVLVLGGYIASAEKWAHFSDEWFSLLSIRPTWRRFKACEVCGSQDEFTQERVRHHYKTIKDYVLADVCMAIPIPAFNMACAEFGLTGADANPYFSAWNGLITMLISNTSRYGITEPIEFIFDSLSEGNKILSGWDHFEKQMPRRWRRMIRGMPSFKKDDDLMPLQAADFAVWWFRKTYIHSDSPDFGMRSIIPWEENPNAYHHFYYDIHIDGIRSILRKIRDFRRFKVSASILLPEYGLWFDWHQYGVPPGKVFA